MKIAACAVLSIGLFLGFGGIASADIIVTNVTITPNGPMWTWAYALATDGSEIVNTNNNPSFFTIYDVIGVQQNGAPGWAANSGVPRTLAPTPLWPLPLVGPTPPGVGVPDDPNILNVSLTFNGTAPVNSSLGTFQFNDSSGSMTLGWFAAEATFAANNAPSVNFGEIPVPSSATPEPGTLALLGSAAFVMLGVRRLVGR